MEGAGLVSQAVRVVVTPPLRTARRGRDFLGVSSWSRGPVGMDWAPPDYVTFCDYNDSRTTIQLKENTAF